MTQITVYDIDTAAIDKIADVNDLSIADVFEMLMEYAEDMMRDQGLV